MIACCTENETSENEKGNREKKDNWLCWHKKMVPKEKKKSDESD
jgi:hypothetical protein